MLVVKSLKLLGHGLKLSVTILMLLAFLGLWSGIMEESQQHSSQPNEFIFPGTQKLRNLFL